MTDSETNTPVMPDTSTIGERTTAVAAQWLTEHHGEAVRLQREDVQEIAFRLLQARVQPTVEAIRTVNGGSGSPNVIHPALRTWFASGDLERRWKRSPAPAGIPAPLVELWDKALDAARTAVRAELQDEHGKAREALARDQGLLDHERDALVEREREFETRVDAQRDLIARLEQEAVASTEAFNSERKARAHDRATLQEERDAARNEVASLDERATALEQELRQSRSDLDAAAAKIAQQEQHLVSAKDAATAAGVERDKARETATEFGLANRGLLAERDAAKQHLQDVNANIHAITESHAAEVARRDAAHAQAMATLRDELDGVREAVARLRGALDERADALKQCAVERDATASERDELKAELWRSKQHAMDLETRLKRAQSSD